MLRARLNFPISCFYQLPFEFVSGLFSRFYSSDSPLSSSQKQKKLYTLESHVGYTAFIQYAYGFFVNHGKT